MQHDGVNGILDLVRDAAGEAAAGREPAGHLDFVADPLYRFRVAHDEQSADLRVFLLHEIEGNLHALAAGRLELPLRNGALALEGIEEGGTDAGIAVEDFADGAAQQLTPGASEESFDRGADQHDTGITGEEHQAILQLGHELIDVVFQCRENFASVADLASEVGNLERDQSVFVMPRGARAEIALLAAGHAVEIAADGFQRSQSEVGDSRREKQREKDRRYRKVERVHDLQIDLALQKDRRNADTNGAEGFIRIRAP